MPSAGTIVTLNTVMNKLAMLDTLTTEMEGLKREIAEQSWFENIEDRRKMEW